MIKFFLIFIILFIHSCANPQLESEKKKLNINETVVVSVDSGSKEQLVVNQGPSMDPVSKNKTAQASKVLGVFLTGGTYRAFAYPEVLNEFDKNAIRVHLISGYEMGALVAALFAKYGSAREIEWRIFKLRNQLKEHTPFSREWMKSLDQFIDSIFGVDGIQDYKVVLALPAYDSINKKFVFLKRGNVATSLKNHFDYFYRSLAKDQNDKKEIDLASLRLDIPIVIDSVLNSEQGNIDKIEKTSFLKVSINQNDVKRILILDSKNQSASDLRNLADFIQRNKPATKEFVNNLLREMKNEENHY
ncbi:MAG: hypothetical protein COW00_05325 [Bdellovibrio sp. CG12_big_fil_rev_8_21_14_0_65_39_13]|nr:MAG: hypothetical protein COW78_17860 [Bdellovibrio sp. CG22_combo_CG10-13_8_21_14_all_39_27]PIQ60654.1 MAG: hypothetical protein COW00_05325 [Bdellovibrio sp. CG12_big_fil_rev_8_21_14_0_65_39_13]PIR37038.1 MAG: hypothetical protein COV37_00685 [Bdellovibrio sp. CG11_big_fil_rev_8_21_14_0_20_39_38]